MNDWTFKLKDVMTAQEAAEIYNVKLDTLNHALIRGQLNDLIEKGWVRKTAGAKSPWLLTPPAMAEYLRRKKRRIYKSNQLDRKEDSM
ncbi:hypothetical protein QO009_003024 [Brevibacillus aydinogluensis]|jgi:hypothetical protein|uniref:helix-turn-helix domain-containing protein n=1 Tax=Brevibacillus aydinogluensis TaxID=927786 RepID=UPI002893132A|nr:helix-turn-helix domain-containing protein [Brevibacillus aydinogluensis]MDT3417129.1 hypothetical protein [Brevibacillus aydinogluensis]